MLWVRNTTKLINPLSFPTCFTFLSTQIRFLVRIVATLWPCGHSCDISSFFFLFSLHTFSTTKFSPLSDALFSISPFQPYYTNRASLPPNSGPRGVPQSSGPRPVTPAHVYQAGPGSQMMMIPGQQLPFPSSPQGPAYFIPSQVGYAHSGCTS